ncbi:MAG: hypothetical protein H0X41_04570 [Chitinophagaceae bacterium]|nr:hypothetical protein [Chitinophagaceae bacterium]
MPKLLFFSRVALICNGCFLVTFLMHYISDIRNGVVPSTIIILGNVLSIVINILLNVIYAMLFLAGRLRMAGVPRWLVAVNFLFFIFQVILLVK